MAIQEIIHLHEELAKATDLRARGQIRRGIRQFGFRMIDEKRS